MSSQSFMHLESSLLFSDVPDGQGSRQAYYVVDYALGLIVKLVTLPLSAQVIILLNPPIRDLATFYLAKMHKIIVSCKCCYSMIE